MLLLLLSHFSPVRLCATPQTAAHQAPVPGILQARIRVSLIAQSAKNLPAMQETWVQFLGWEDALEKEMAIHSSILAWKIPWTEEPGGLQSMGSQESDTT